MKIPDSLAPLAHLPIFPAPHLRNPAAHGENQQALRNQGPAPQEDQAGEPRDFTGLRQDEKDVFTETGRPWGGPPRHGGHETDGEEGNSEKGSGEEGSHEKDDREENSRQESSYQEDCREKAGREKNGEEEGTGSAGR
ncbi:MAG: hypothetical protein J5I62_01435 [Flavobacteriales bacterium]|nr:hypothetical protein [Flavobacteriales bacterium]MEB2341964.1 hypothetical protein [Flavobacteriia bacterium]